MSKIAIEGVDVDRGIYLSGGVEAFYLETLAVYYQECVSRIKDIKNCLASENWPKYINNVHALKSASANIGAGTLSAEAKALEMAGREDNISFIKQNTDSLLKNLELLLQKIKAVLPQN